MALEGLGEKLKSFFKPKDDPRFKGQGRRLGTAEANSSGSRLHNPQPAVGGGRTANQVGGIETSALPIEASTPLKPPPQPLGPGGRPALVVSRSHRTADVVLDAAVMANTPTRKETYLVAPVIKPSPTSPSSSDSRGHFHQDIGLGASSPPQVATAAAASPSPCCYSQTVVAGGGCCRIGGAVGGGDCGGGGGEGCLGLGVEVPGSSSGGGGGGRGGGLCSSRTSRDSNGGGGGGGGERGEGGGTYSQVPVGGGGGRSQSRGTPSSTNSMVSTINTPTAAEKRMGGFRCPAPPTDSAMADYGLAPATSQAYELQRCLGLVLSSRPLPHTHSADTSNIMSASMSPSSATQAAAEAQALTPPPPSPQPSRPALPPNPTPTPVGGGGRSGEGVGGPEAGPRECCDALLRVLHNVMTRPEESKFRQIRLSNPRVQESIVRVPGGVEFLEAAGFQMHFFPDDGSEMANQGYLLLPAEVPPTALAEPFRILSSVMAAHGFGAGAPTISNHHAQAPTARSTGHLPPLAPAPPQPQPPAAFAPAQHQHPQQSSVSSGKAAALQSAPAPAIERRTQVLLPAAPDVEVPDWFFERTGAEIREQWVAMVRRREEEERFMTRTMKEVRRQQEAAAAAAAGGGDGGAPANVATVRVRFPEGVCLQGRFGAAEPVSRVFEWVASALRAPALTFELIKPDRRPLETTITTAAAGRSTSTAAGKGLPPVARPGGGGGAVPLTVRAADMLPSVLLNLRPTSPEAAALSAKNLPLLSDELLCTTKPQ